MSRAAVLAVDGGNSKTDVALCTADGELLAAVRGPTTSHQAVGLDVGLDRLAGLVAERPEGRNVYYRAQPEGLTPLVDWMSHYGVFWRDRFANLRTLLKEIDP